MPRKKMTEAEKQARAAAAEAKKKAELEEAERLHKKKIMHDELWAIAFLAIGVFLALSLFTKTTGGLGLGIEAIFGGLLGKVAYALPFFLIIFGVLIFAKKTAYLTWRTLVCSVVFFILLACIFARYTEPLRTLADTAAANKTTISTITFNALFKGTEAEKSIYAQGIAGGGVIGVFLANIIIKVLGTPGLWIIAIVGIVITLMFLIDTPVSALFDRMKMKRAARKKLAQQQLEFDLEHGTEPEPLIPDVLSKPEAELPSVQPAKPDITSTMPSLNLEPISQMEQSNAIEIEPEPILPESVDELLEKLPIEEDPYYENGEYSENQKKILEYVSDDALFGNKEDVQAEPKAKITAADVAEVKKEVVDEIEKSIEKKTVSRYKFPPLDFLRKASSKAGGKSAELEDMKYTLERTLQSFGVDAKVVDVIKGPAVTRFEVQPAPGVKVSSISKLHDDLALNLMARSLRIEAPIPGKAAVGIEVSNQSVSMVTLREVLEAKEFKQAKSKISVAVGKSISGESIVCNIKDMPHLLIAGSTGSGKSVCINSMLISLLYKSTPDEVKLILIDPKVVELSIYNGIPHLLIPVVTEPAKASAALGWAVGEMNERYNKFAEEGVRDLSGYNDYVRANGEPEKVMPQIVIVIDELHDLMLSAKNTVEDNIARLAAKARAAGMHLIVATQRPSVDVITGVIKNNIPSRIAFAVGNAMDSRTILDEGGAEHLLGKGDMLYAPQGSSKPLRVQGCLVSDSEVSAVIDFVKASNAAAEYSESVQTIISKATAPAVEKQCAEEEEEELKQAIEYVVRSQKCSVSMLQGHFRIGYNHAARIVNTMEEMGIIGPADGAKKRKVNLTLEEWMAQGPANTQIPEEI